MFIKFLAGALLKSSEAFTKWSASLSSSDKFKSFIQYVQQNGPKLLTILKNIGSGLIGMFTAFAPMSADMLTGLVNLTARFKGEENKWQCSYLSAKTEGHKTLAKPYVKKEIERLKAEQQQGVFLDAQAVLQKYIDIAFADITDFATFGKREIPTEDEEGNPITKEVNYVDFKESAEVDGTIITEVKNGKDGVSVKLADKMKALEFLAKYTDLLSENDRKKLQFEKLKAKTELTKARIKKTKAEVEKDAHEDAVTIVDDIGSDHIDEG